MYEIVSGSDVFMVDTWAEVKAMWEEIVVADGADDAEITLRFASEE